MGSTNGFDDLDTNCEPAVLKAFIRSEDGTLQTFNSIDGLSRAESIDKAEIWVDLEAPDETELKAVGQLFSLDADPLDDCLHGEQRPRIDEFENYIFLVLYGMLVVDDEIEIKPRKLAAFCSKRYLVTVHDTRLRSIREVQEQCERYPAVMLRKGPTNLFYRLVDCMADKYVGIVEEYERQLDLLDEQSLSDAVDDAVLPDSARLLHELLELRRVAAAQRDLLTPVAQGEYDYVAESLEHRFSHVRDHFTQVLERIDVLRERIRGVRDNYHAALTKHTNTIVKTLTVFSAVLLPLTFIASIYGMNFKFLPPAEHPVSFWAILVVMICLAAGLLWVFRRQRWL